VARRQPGELPADQVACLVRQARWAWAATGRAVPAGVVVVGFTGEGVLMVPVVAAARAMPVEQLYPPGRG
jgi:hypothetical protein